MKDKNVQLLAAARERMYLNVKKPLHFVKSLVIIFLFFIVLMVGFGTFIYQATAKTMQDQIGNRCHGIASVVAALLEQDAAGYLEFSETLDTDSEYYRSTKKLLEDIRYANDDSIRFLYTETRISDTEMMYVLDGEREDVEYFSRPGDTDQLTVTRKAAYAVQTDYIGQTFTENNYGRLLSAYAPIHDDDGQFIGFVGVDVSAEQYDEVMRYQMLIIIGSIVMLTLLMIVLSALLLRMYNEKVRADQESHSKTTFVARMSHEIRIPMNAIMGMSELMLRENLTPAVLDQARNVHQAATNLLAIINDILDFSKIESGKMEVIEKPYQFSSLINDVINIFRNRLTDKPILFVANIDSRIPDQLIGDEVHFRQILTNVLANAVKYTNEGFVSLNIDSKKKDQHTVMLSIKVTDTGIGIQKEDLDKLFEDFNQLDRETNRSVEGTGLGLAITRNLCRALGGDIEVISGYGEGSTFTITLPQRFDSYIRFAEVEEPETTAVLVYETRKAYAQSICFTVENLGVRCVLVTSHSMFLKELHNHSYSHVFASSFLLDSSRRIMQQLSPDITLVLISEYGDSIKPGLTSIVMPAHAVSIADILNGMDGEVYYTESIDEHIRFTAPDARVLIVDDIATNLHITKGLLAPFQMMIDCAGGGREAIDMICCNRYDLILMDHMMPEIDGIETTEQIRMLGEIDKYYLQLPIVALSANAVSGMREMFLQNQMNDFLSKPIEIAKLYAVVEKWIPKRLQREVVSADTAVSGSGLQIDGIDTELGLAMTGGDQDNYLQILKIFYEDSIEKSRQIKEALEVDAVDLFTTYVHALKGAAASIGAADISEAAKLLEQAGSNEDMEFITEKNEAFLEQLTWLNKNISAALPDMQIAAVSETVEDREFLTVWLTILKEALAVIDIEQIDKAQEQLQTVSWSGEIQKQLERIYRSVLLFEYAEAAFVIDQILDF